MNYPRKNFIFRFMGGSFLPKNEVYAVGEVATKTIAPTTVIGDKINATYYPVGYIPTYEFAKSDSINKDIDVTYVYYLYNTATSQKSEQIGSYKHNEGLNSTEYIKNQPINVGSYYIELSATATGYTSYNKSYILEIGKASQKIKAEITEATTGIKFDGNSKVFNYSILGAYSGDTHETTLTMRDSLNNVITTITDAGTYTLTFSSPKYSFELNNAESNAFIDEHGNKVVTVIVDNADVSLDIVATHSAEYSGEKVNLASFITFAKGVGNIDLSSAVLINKGAEIFDAGNYQVEYSIKGLKNYNDITKICNLTITAKTIIILVDNTQFIRIPDGSILAVNNADDYILKLAYTGKEPNIINVFDLNVLFNRDKKDFKPTINNGEPALKEGEYTAVLPILNNYVITYKINAGSVAQENLKNITKFAVKIDSAIITDADGMFSSVKDWSFTFDQSRNMYLQKERREYLQSKEFLNADGLKVVVRMQYDIFKVGIADGGSYKVKLATLKYSDTALTYVLTYGNLPMNAGKYLVEVAYDFDNNKEYKFTGTVTSSSYNLEIKAKEVAVTFENIGEIIENKPFEIKAYYFDVNNVKQYCNVSYDPNMLVFVAGNYKAVASIPDSNYIATAGTTNVSFVIGINNTNNYIWIIILAVSVIVLGLVILAVVIGVKKSKRNKKLNKVAPKIESAFKNNEKEQPSINNEIDFDILKVDTKNFDNENKGIEEEQTKTIMPAISTINESLEKEQNVLVENNSDEKTPLETKPESSDNTTSKEELKVKVEPVVKAPKKAKPEKKPVAKKKIEKKVANKKTAKKINKVENAENETDVAKKEVVKETKKTPKKTKPSVKKEATKIPKKTKESLKKGTTNKSTAKKSKKIDTKIGDEEEVRTNITTTTKKVKLTKNHQTTRITKTTINPDGTVTKVVKTVNKNIE
ncbi:MAG: hypothetical protein RR334_01755 [Clostridia bacterium]